MKTLLALAAIYVLCMSCAKQTAMQGSTGSSTIEFYMLKECHWVPGKCQIDAQKSTLQDTPVISNQEILEYSRKDYQFRLTDLAVQKVKTFQDNMVFAVTVDRQVIYYFIYKPVTSSSSCDESITMDVDRPSGHAVNMSLGYPATDQSSDLPDRRNANVLLSALSSQGKLK